MLEHHLDDVQFHPVLSLPRELDIVDSDGALDLIGVLEHLHDRRPSGTLKEVHQGVLALRPRRRVILEGLGLPDKTGFDGLFERLWIYGDPLGPATDALL